MAQKELVLHPETGALAEVVHSYQGVELGTLQDEVNKNQDILADVQARKQAKLDELSALSDEETTAQGVLEDSKSSFVRGQELVGAAAAGVDAGATGAGGEVPAEVAGENF